MAPIRSNRYFNDPALGEAFSSLSALFAPPSGADLAGYATATAKKEEASRLAQLFASAKGFDQQAVAAGVYNPSQSYYAVDQADATTRRGQDITSDTARANNAADNIRALEQTRLQQTGDTTRKMLDPVTSGATRFVPPSIAELFSVPETQVGIVTAQPGERISTADGRTFEGAPKPLNESEKKAALLDALTPEEQRAIGLSIGAVKLNEGEIASMPDGTRLQGNAKPLSETEWQAQQNERLRQAGQLSDQQLVDAVVGNKTPVEAMGPDGRAKFMSPGAAVREGAQPAPKSPGVQVNMGQPSDTKLREKLDENEGKRLSEMKNAANTSAGLAQDLDLLRELIKVAPQGPLEGRLAKMLPGFSNGGAAFDTVVQRAAPGMRVEGSGSTSDIEFKGMLASLPNMSNRAEANRLIADMMSAKAAFNIKRGDVITAYQTGEIDAAELQKQLSALNKQSVMSPALREMIISVNGGRDPTIDAEPAVRSVDPGTVMDGYRFKGGDPANPSSWELAN